MAMKIQQASGAIIDFLKKTLGQDAKVMSIRENEKGWIADAEVYEESSFIKSLGLNTRVKDKNIYSVQLGQDLEVLSYSLLSQQKQQ